MNDNFFRSIDDVPHWGVGENIRGLKNVLVGGGGKEVAFQCYQLCMTKSENEVSKISPLLPVWNIGTWTCLIKMAHFRWLKIISKNATVGNTDCFYYCCCHSNANMAGKGGVLTPKYRLQPTAAPPPSDPLIYRRLLKNEYGLLVRRRWGIKW